MPVISRSVIFVPTELLLSRSTRVAASASNSASPSSVIWVACCRMPSPLKSPTKVEGSLDLLPPRNLENEVDRNLENELDKSIEIQRRLEKLPMNMR